MEVAEAVEGRRVRERAEAKAGEIVMVEAGGDVEREVRMTVEMEGVGVDTDVGSARVGFSMIR